MKYYFISIFLCLLSITLLTCGKYWPDDQRPLKGEWIYSVKLCSCEGGDLFLDTIWPVEGQNGLKSANIQITNRTKNTVHMYLNDNFASAVQFDSYETGTFADYPGNYDDENYGIRLFSETDSFLYSLPNDIGGYNIVIETPDFPFKSDIYQNEMDTFTVNFFKFID